MSYKIAWNKTTVLNITHPNWLKKTEKGIEKLWKDAISEFVHKIINEDLIHVDSGMSRATILPLSRYVRGLYSVARASIQPKGGKRKKYDPPPGWNKEGDLKSIAHGERLGKDAFTVEIGDRRNPFCSFEFHIEVYQYFLHEHGLGRGHSVAWNSLPKAIGAFEDFIKQNWKKYIPDVDELFTAGGLK